MMVHVGNCMWYYTGFIVATTIISNDMLSQLVCAVRDPLVTKHSLPIESELKCWIYSYRGGPKNSGTSCLQGTLGWEGNTDQPVNRNGRIWPEHSNRIVVPGPANCPAASLANMPWLQSTGFVAKSVS